MPFADTWTDTWSDAWGVYVADTGTTHLSGIAEILTGSFTRDLTVSVFHGPERVAEGLRVQSWGLDGDVGANVPHSGSAVIVYESVAGESYVPVGTSGDLSPFRARVELAMEIIAGDFSEKVSLGTFRVTRIRSARDYFATLTDGRQVVAGSVVEVEFLSLEEDVRRWGLRFPEQPPSLASVFDEIRRLTGMPVEETVTDQPIPSGSTWEAAQGGRLDAVHTLGTMLGGTAVVNERGAWEIIPDAIGPATGLLTIGADGTVVDVGTEIDTDAVYNEVVGVFEDADRNPIYSIARAPAGSDLDPDGLYRPSTRYYSSEFVTTQAQADSAVQAILALSIGDQMYDVPITCHVNPTVRLGDVVELRDWVRPLSGRVVKLSMSDSALMQVTLRVARPLGV